MSLTVRIPTVMRNYTESNATVDCEGSTVKEVLDDLTSKYPGLKEVIYDDAGELHKYVNIYLGDDDIRYIGGIAAQITDQKDMTLLPAVAGGSL